MRQLTEKQIINQNSLFELHQNVCFHADRVLSNLSENSILHLKDFSQRTCRLLCQFISDDANIFDILNDPEIITILDSFYKELANNILKAKKLSFDGYNYISSNFSLENMLDKTIAIYKKVWS